MAKSDNRPKITHGVHRVPRRNYTTVKNQVNDRDRIELKKYCRWCRGHTLHRERAGRVRSRVVVDRLASRGRPCRERPRPW